MSFVIYHVDLLATLDWCGLHMHCVHWHTVCLDGNLFEFVIVSLDNKQWQFTAQSAEVCWHATVLFTIHKQYCISFLLTRTCLIVTFSVQWLVDSRRWQPRGFSVIFQMAINHQKKQVSLVSEGSNRDFYFPGKGRFTAKAPIGPFLFHAGAVLQTPNLSSFTMMSVMVMMC